MIFIPSHISLTGHSTILPSFCKVIYHNIHLYIFSVPKMA